MMDLPFNCEENTVLAFIEFLRAGGLSPSVIQNYISSLKTKAVKFQWQVQVFNRWGNKVFEIEGYDNTSRTWAAESSVGIILGNNEVPDGTYFYVIDLGNGDKPRSGFVVVNR